MADLAGLVAILRESRPDLVFLQEVNLSLDRLKAVVGGLGYSAWLSTCHTPKRTIAVLSLHSNTIVSDLQPGYLQQVQLKQFYFLHFHSPSGCAEYQARLRLFNLARDVINTLPSTPVLVGDFNCVTAAIDLENVVDRRICPVLCAIVHDFLYVDSYRVLHPNIRMFSWFRRGAGAARLDRLYLPPLWAGRPRLARYIPTASDHSALLVLFDVSGLGLGPVRPPVQSFYWKFNSSLIRESDFLQCFNHMWEPVVATRDGHPGGVADWWELVAKPAIVAFCQTFSKRVAGRRTATRRFITRALELALEQLDWPTVEGCRGRLRKMDLEAAGGLVVRSGQAAAAGEMPGLFHAAMEGRHGGSPGLHSVKTPAGAILTEPVALQQEVFGYFQTLFHGRHGVAVGRPEPVDSGRPFVSDLTAAGPFLAGLPTLTPDQQLALEEPFELIELAAAVSGAAASKSPGLDGLSYELYKAVLPLVGPSLLAAFNHMLARGELGPSLCAGVVRLLPKVAGVPTAAQLRPITLLNTDYKLLTKMFVARLLPVLPDVLQATQLCSVRGRSIFDGAAAVVSAATYLHHKKRPGYLISLDFFHAYDRVCLSWVDTVLAALGFGRTFRRWIAVLHAGATATFMLHGLSPALAVLFSIRQGDPLAMLLFVIQLEPLLHYLQSHLVGLRMAGLREASLGYVDDVAILSDAEADFVTCDEAVSIFEAASGAILNRNRKSVVVGLGSWAGRQDWPLPWLEAATSVKLYGVVVAPLFADTLKLSWERTVAGLESTLLMWRSRSLPLLSQRSFVLNCYGFSKLWYLAQILPLPRVFLGRILRAASSFLWQGRLESISWGELVGPRHAGGLGVACVASRAQAMLAKQACHRLAGAGQPAAHLSFWLGLRLLHYFPGFRTGLHAEVMPTLYADLAALLLEVLAFDFVEPAHLGAVTAAAIYIEFTSTPPPPKVEAHLPDLPWSRIWGRLALGGLPPQLAEIGFSYLNNILPLQVRRHRLRKVASPACERCGSPVEDVLHFFTACPRVAAAWECLLFYICRLLGGPISDRSLLFLAFPISVHEIHIIYAVLSFADLVWSGRHEVAALTPQAVKACVGGASGIFKSVFII